MYSFLCFSLTLNFPTLQLDIKANTPTSPNTAFNKCHFLILEERDLEHSASIIENVARIFNQYPAFTIILSKSESQDLDQFRNSNRGNSPLIIVNPLKVYLVYQSVLLLTTIMNRKSLELSVLKKTEKKFPNIPGMF